MSHNTDTEHDQSAQSPQAGYAPQHGITTGIKNKIQIAKNKAQRENLKKQIIAIIANAFYIEHNKNHPTNTITKDKARQMVEAAYNNNITDSKGEEEEEDQVFFERSIERFIAYSTLADAGCLHETGDVNFNILQARQAGETSTHFARGKDTHEEGRFIARETMLRHKLTDQDKGNGKKYFLKTGKHGDSSKLAQGFLEEMLANDEPSNIYDQQLNTWFSKSLIEANTNKVVVNEQNFEQWLNQGEYGELVILNYIQGIKRQDQTLSKFLATENFSTLSLNQENNDTLNQKNIRKFNIHRPKLINKAINIDGEKGLNDFCNNYSDPADSKHSNITTPTKYKKIYKLLQQDSARNDQPLTLTLEEKQIVVKNPFIEGGTISSQVKRFFSKSAAQRSAALRKPIAESLIKKIKDNDTTGDEKINAVYQLALITDKDAWDIAAMFNLNENLINQIDNIKPPSAEVLALDSNLDTLLKQDKKESKDDSYNLVDIKNKFSANQTLTTHKKSFERYLKNSIKELGTNVRDLSKANKTKLQNYIYKLSILTEQNHTELANELITNNSGNLELQQKTISQTAAQPSSSPK
jgi:hypothetical protein